jgi:hypothetical protein
MQKNAKRSDLLNASQGIDDSIKKIRDIHARVFYKSLGYIEIIHRDSRGEL